MNFGLLLLPEDSRDWSLGAAFNYPPLSEIPDEFGYEPLEIKNQGTTNFCSAFASCSASEQQEGITLEPSYTFAWSKFITGDLEQPGQNLRAIAKAHVKYGAIEEKDSPFNVSNQTERFLSDINNWPSNLKDLAVKHAKSSFLSVDGPYDHFDNIRAATWMFKDSKRAAFLGITWGWPMTTSYIHDPSPNGSGHALAAPKFKRINGELMMGVQQSYGPEAGINGIQWLSRQVVNEGVDKYGAFMFVDMTYNEYIDRIRPQVQSTLDKILAILKQLAAYFSQTKSQTNTQPQVDTKEEVKPVETMQQMVLRVCDEQGCNELLTKQIYATIEWESGFNPLCENVNPNKTVDYGICQYNSYWYIGKGKPIDSIDEALHNPEKCVRVMCQQAKKGMLKDWVGYKSGNYMRYMADAERAYSQRSVNMKQQA